MKIANIHALRRISSPADLRPNLFGVD